MTKDELKWNLGDRWGEFVERRGSEKYVGLKGSALRNRVLDDMGLGVDGLPLDGGGREPLRKVRGRKARQGEDDVEWIYRVLADEGVREGDAPNVGAWGWLLAIREDKGLRSDFYKTIWAQRVRDAADSRKRYGDDGEEVLERVEKLLREVGG